MAKISMKLRQETISCDAHPPTELTIKKRNNKNVQFYIS